MQSTSHPVLHQHRFNLAQPSEYAQFTNNEKQFMHLHDISMIFTVGHVLKFENAMLPCISTNKTFAAKLVVIPTQDDSNDRVILGQDLMQLLVLNISVQDDTILWDKKEFVTVGWKT